MGIPTECETKGKFPFIPTGENTPTGRGSAMNSKRGRHEMTNQGFGWSGAVRFVH